MWSMIYRKLICFNSMIMHVLLYNWPFPLFNKIMIEWELILIFLFLSDECFSLQLTFSTLYLILIELKYIWIYSFHMKFWSLFLLSVLIQIEPKLILTMLRFVFVKYLCINCMCKIPFYFMLLCCMILFEKLWNVREC